jgi:hypothetical protein
VGDERDRLRELVVAVRHLVLLAARRPGLTVGRERVDLVGGLRRERG